MVEAAVEKKTGAEDVLWDLSIFYKGIDDPAIQRDLDKVQIMADEFHTLWWVPESAPLDDVRAYLRGLDRAEKALDSNLKKYLPLWEKCIPPDFKDVHNWDYAKFTRSERFVYQPIPRKEFDETLEQVKRWDLDQYLKERKFENLVYRAPA